MKLIILIFSHAFGWNQIINVPEDTKEIHLDIYLNNNNITTTSTTIEMRENYDLPDNYESILNIPCENDKNNKTNVRNQLFDRIPRSCLLGCQEWCFRSFRRHQSGCFTVPNLCNTSSDCPDIGKNCSSYLIPSLGCKNGKCKYGPVLTGRLVAKHTFHAKRFEPCKCERLNRRKEHFSST